MRSLLFTLFGTCMMLSPFSEHEVAAKKRKSPETALTAADSTIYDGATQMPLFRKKPWDTFTQWAAERIEYPPTLLREGLGGRVVVRFVIEKDGSIDEVEVVESPYLLLSAEVLRVIGLSPRWTPARNEKGEPVRVYVKVPFLFSVSETRKDRTLPPQLRQGRSY